MASGLDDLIAISTKLRRARARVAALSSERDTKLRSARDNGAGWTDLRRATGLTDRALQKALARTSPGLDSDPCA